MKEYRFISLERSMMIHMHVMKEYIVPAMEKQGCYSQPNKILEVQWKKTASPDGNGDLLADPKKLHRDKDW